jgi:ethanolamine ammonia-lyase large subunit
LNERGFNEQEVYEKFDVSAINDNIIISYAKSSVVRTINKSKHNINIFHTLTNLTKLTIYDDLFKLENAKKRSEDFNTE